MVYVSNSMQIGTEIKFQDDYSIEGINLNVGENLRILDITEGKDLLVKRYGYFPNPFWINAEHAENLEKDISDMWTFLFGKEDWGKEEYQINDEIIVTAPINVPEKRYSAHPTKYVINNVHIHQLNASKYNVINNVRYLQVDGRWIKENEIGKKLKRDPIPINVNTARVRIGRGDNTMTVAEFDQRRQQLKQQEDFLLQNYCAYQLGNRWCRYELKAVQSLKKIYGDDIRIVNNRNPDIANEFDLLNPVQTKTELSIHLTHLGDVADQKYTHQEFMNLPQPHKDTINRNLRAKIARVHNVNEEEITITGHENGCDKVNYTLPKQIPAKDIAKLEAGFQKELDQFEQMEIHAAFFRPEFDINMFDKNGHKDFRNENDKFRIGGETYKQPRGWVRMGLNVLDGRYGDDDTWLTPFKDPGNWVRGYHGHKAAGGDGLAKAAEIVKSGGLHPGNRNVHGVGVYWSDDPNFANGAYDARGKSHRISYDSKLMLAIRPGSYSNNGGGNFHSEDYQSDVRVYGILVRG